jgi:hypothetical protein
MGIPVRRTWAWLNGTYGLPRRASHTIVEIRQDVAVTDPSETTSTQAAMDYIASKAPEDVLLTMAWLRDNGWHLTRASVWEESFGNAVAEFRKADVEVQIVRDRGQWMVSVRLSTWDDWTDLALVLDAKSGRTQWDEPSGNPSDNNQLPVGVKWAETLPDVVKWLATTENVQPKLDELRAERFRQRFPHLDQFR